MGFAKFAWSASRFDVHLEMTSGEKKQERRLNQVSSQSERNKLITQLEFLLDR
jgi:hypothetical protein